MSADKLATILARALPVLCLLAANLSGGAVYGMFRAREILPTITQYGPLPEVHVPLLDYVTLGFSFLLALAGLAELVRIRLAAPVALFALGVLAVTYYLPALWDEISSQMWFASKLGRSVGTTTAMLLIHVAATICAAALTYLRIHLNQSFKIAWKRRATATQTSDTF